MHKTKKLLVILEFAVNSVESTTALQTRQTNLTQYVHAFT